MDVGAGGLVVHASFLGNWLFGCVVVWSVGSLLCWPVGWLFGWWLVIGLVGGLSGCLVGRLVGWFGLRVIASTLIGGEGGPD